MATTAIIHYGGISYRKFHAFLLSFGQRRKNGRPFFRNEIIAKTVVSNSAPNEHRNKKQTKTIKDRTEKAEIKMDIPKRKSKEKTLEELNEKYANDPKFREEKRKIYRERYQNDSEYREKTLERSKSRYHNDPEYRKATIERAKERYRKNKSK